MRFFKSCFAVAADSYRNAYILLFLIGVLPVMIFSYLFDYAWIPELGFAGLFLSAGSALLVSAMVCATLWADLAAFGSSLSKQPVIPEIINCSDKGHTVYRNALIGDQIIRILFYLAGSGLFYVITAKQTGLSMEQAATGALALTVLTFGLSQISLTVSRHFPGNTASGLLMAFIWALGFSVILVIITDFAPAARAKDLISVPPLAVLFLAGIALGVFHVVKGSRCMRLTYADLQEVSRPRIARGSDSYVPSGSSVKQNGIGKALALMALSHGFRPALILSGIFLLVGIIALALGALPPVSAVNLFLLLPLTVILGPLFSMEHATLLACAPERKHLQTTVPAQILFMGTVLIWFLAVLVRTLSPFGERWSSYDWLSFAVYFVVCSFVLGAVYVPSSPKDSFGRMLPKSILFFFVLYAVPTISAGDGPAPKNATFATGGGVVAISLFVVLWSAVSACIAYILFRRMYFRAANRETVEKRLKQGAFL